MSAGTWRMAACLGGTPTTGLLGEVNAAAPNRDKRSDGGVGDTKHARGKSEHNPCSCCNVVCARDFTHDPKNGFDAEAFAEWLRGRVTAEPPERRVLYVIWKQRIFSGPDVAKPAGVWRPYKGKNPHTKHVHVSIRHGADLYDDDAPWGWPPA